MVLLQTVLRSCEYLFRLRLHRAVNQYYSSGPGSSSSSSSNTNIFAAFGLFKSQVVLQIPWKSPLWLDYFPWPDATMSFFYKISSILWYSKKVRIQSHNLISAPLTPPTTPAPYRTTTRRCQCSCYEILIMTSIFSKELKGQASNPLILRRATLSLL